MKRFFEFNQSIKTCVEISSYYLFLKTKDKVINTFLIKQGSDSSMDELILKIKNSFLAKDLKFARSLIIEAELKRRSIKVYRQKHSLSFYRIQYLLLNRQLSYARILMRNLKDQVLKNEIYTFMNENKIELTHSEKENLKLIELSLGLSSALNQISIPKIKSETVQKLLSILSQNPSLDKEALFQYVFGIEYDPVIHDSKIYKLILKAKKEISSDIILNSYGKYSLNFEKYKFIS
jgi:hypothetical protein